MTCDWLMMCEDIQRHANGGMSILGVYTRLTLDRLPGSLRDLHVAFRLRDTPGTTAEGRLRILDPDGQPLRETPSDRLTIPDHGMIDGFYPLGPVSLKRPGDYSIELMMNDAVVRTLQLPVRVIHLAPGGQA